MNSAPVIAPAGSPRTEAAARSERRHDLDWLRVIAILLLLFYHSGMAFVEDWGWHLKNSETSEIFQEWMYFMSRWRMALLFFISGGGTWFVLKKATAGDYVRRRFLRLFIPLAFGIFVVVPPQIYMERLAQGAAFGSYLDFYWSVFAFEPYPKGNTSWHHLWFVAYLFLFSIIGLPLFLWLRSRKALLDGLAARATAPMLYAFGFPLAAILAVLFPKFRGPQDLVSDWAMFLYYFVFFASGFLFTMHVRFGEVLEARRQTTLRLACLCYFTLCWFRWNDKDPDVGYTAQSALYLALVAFNAWFWVLTILGYGRRYLNRSSGLLAYANEAIYRSIFCIKP